MNATSPSDVVAMHACYSDNSPDSKQYVQYAQHKYHLLGESELSLYQIIWRLFNDSSTYLCILVAEILLINITLGVASFLQATAYCEPNLR